MAMMSFGVAAFGCLIAWLFVDSPMVGAAGILFAALAMTTNDGYGNALFFRACRPSRRVEMTPTFTTYRDIAEVSHAALFAVLLIVFEIEIVFFCLALILGALAILSRTIHPRL